jgi:hypothetical protein
MPRSNDKPSESRSSDRLNETLQHLLTRVQEMSPGGDLEELIEDGIAKMNRELYASCLEARRQSDTSDSEDFSPSSVPVLREDVAGE